MVRKNNRSELLESPLNKGSWKPLLYALLTFLVLSGITALFWYQYSHSRHVEEKIQLNSSARQIKAVMENWVNDRISIIRGVAEGLAMHDAPVEYFNETARPLASLLDGFRAVNWVDSNWTIRLTIPSEGNEGALGKNLNNHENIGVQEALRKAVETKRVTRTPIINLFQGGRAFTLYYPVYKEEELLGFVNGVFDLDTLIEIGVAPRRIHRDIDLEITEAWDNSIVFEHKHKNVFMPNNHERKVHVDTKISIVDKPWILKISPINGHYVWTNLNNPVNVLFLSCVILSLLASVSTYLILNRRYELNLKRNEINQAEDIYRQVIEKAAGVSYRKILGEPNYLFIGENIKSLTGYEPEEITNTKWVEITLHKIIDDPMFDGNLEEYHQSYIEGARTFYSSQMCIQTKSGEERWLSDRSIVESKKENNTVVALGILQDITDRKTFEIERERLNNLIHRLNELHTIEEVGREIALESRKLFHHDGFMFCLFDEAQNIAREIYSEDTPVNSTEIEPVTPREYNLNDMKKSPLYSSGKLLVNREDISDSSDFVIGGLKERRSASMVMMNIEVDHRVVGAITIHSYKANFYNESHLGLLGLLISNITSVIRRVDAEKKIRDSETNLRNIIDPVPIPIFARDKTGTLLIANKAVVDSYGLEPEEVIGKKLDIFYNNQEDINKLSELDQQVLKTKKPLDIPELILNHPTHGKRHLKSSLIPYKPINSEDIAVLGFALDITNQVKAEKYRSALHQLALNLTKELTLFEVGQALSETAQILFNNDSFFLSYYDWENEQVNRAYVEDTPIGSDKPQVFDESMEIVKINSDYLVAKPFLENRPIDFKDSSNLMLGEKTRLSRSLMYVPILIDSKLMALIGVHSYDHNRYNDDDLKVLITLASQAEGAIARIHANAERERMANKLLHIQKLESLGVLAGGIAHDFNNLLTGVMGNAGLGLMLLPGESPAREPLTKIEMASQRAADLCKQLLAYSGKGKFVIQPISLSKVVTEMTDLLSSAISRKATIDFDIEDDLPMMEGDVTQIRQVVMNLITNASEALEDGKGTIILKTGVQQLTNDYLTETFIKDPISIGEYVYVEVSDTGCGMSKETISRIFDPFYSTKFTGRGLGLAAVLGIIRGHKGTISVYSEINKGSRIKVFFPSIIISQSEGNISSPPKKFDSGWRSSGNILIIDDELTVRQTLHTLLSNLGFDPMEATGGKVAIELLEESTDYRAIFLDMTMPEMDGAEVFSRIQEIDDSIPVILTSGYNQQDAINRFAAEGLAGFIQKPFQFHDFQALLQKLLDPQ